ncbi:MAG TPA: hypothetical protein VGK29_14680 [Paludibaculum sp.]|jgi:hypothetical protein
MATGEEDGALSGFEDEGDSESEGEGTAGGAAVDTGEGEDGGGGMFGDFGDEDDGGGGGTGSGDTDDDDGGGGGTGSDDTDGDDDGGGGGTGSDDTDGDDDDGGGGTGSDDTDGDDDGGGGGTGSGETGDDDDGDGGTGLDDTDDDDDDIGGDTPGTTGPGSIWGVPGGLWSVPGTIGGDGGGGDIGIGTTIGPCPFKKIYTVTITGPDGITIPCTIVPAGGRLRLRGVPQPPTSGTYQWSTTSGRIALANAYADTVDVWGGQTASPSRGAETVQLVFTPSGEAPLAPVTINVTVAIVRFSESQLLSWGWDDMDNPNGELPHASVLKSDKTRVRVSIEGGVNGDELKYVCDDPSVALGGNGAAAPAFDLSVSAGGYDSAETLLRAKCKCEDEPDFSAFYVNVYKLKVVEAAVAKVWDSASPATALKFGGLNVAGWEFKLNTKYKAAVAVTQLEDCGLLDIRYDLNNDGYLTYEVGGSGPEFEVIRDEFRRSCQRIIVVRNLQSLYYLDKGAKQGDSELTFRSKYFPDGFYFKNGQTATLQGPTQETLRLKQINRSSGVVTIDVTPINPEGRLLHDHPEGSGLIFPAAGWSGDPIVVTEGEATDEGDIGWTFGHELGHSKLFLADVDAPTDIMNYCRGNPDHRLRYKLLPRHYKSGTENQWQLIPRDD